MVHGDEDQIIELLVDAFDEWRTRKENAKEYYKWLYLENPLKENIISVAQSQEEIIGAKHDLIINIKLGDQVTKWCYGTDAVINPEYRGKGIYTKLRIMKYEILANRDIIGTYGYTTNPIIIQSEGKAKGIIPANVHFPERIIRYIRIKDIGLHLDMKNAEQKNIKKIGYYLLKGESYIKKREFINEVSDIQIVETDKITEDYDELWQKASKGINFGVVRDSEYIKWRYLNPSNPGYYLFEARKDSQLKGFIVFKIFNYDENYQTGHIVDYLFDKELPEVPHLLTKKILDIADINKINSVDCLVIDGCQFSSVLLNNGFIDNKEQIVIRYNTKNNQDISQKIQKSKPNQLHITQGDLFLL